MKTPTRPFVSEQEEEWLQTQHASTSGPALPTDSGTILRKSARTASIPESHLQRQVIEWANYLPGVRLWRRNVGMLQGEYKGKKRFVRFGFPGMADTTGIGPGGVHIEIELKRAGKVPSDEQFGWLEQCRQQGAIAFWADNFDWAAEQLNTAMVEKGLWP